MSEKSNVGPAFPKAGLDPWDRAQSVQTGMTLRDYAVIKFAAAWTVALAARHDTPGYSDSDAGYEALALAEKQVDAMLFERAK